MMHAGMRLPRPPAERLRSRFRTETPLERGRLIVFVTLVLLTLVTWIVTLDHTGSMSRSGNGAMVHDEMAMAGASGADWSPGGVMAFLGFWAAMMSAMMFPAAAPMVLLIHAVHAKRGGGYRAIFPSGVFATGYLLIWVTAGLIVYPAMQLVATLTSGLSSDDRGRWSSFALGVVLIAAGLYQLTPLKDTCLSVCRSPLNFVMQYWREGRLGAVVMGIRHGVYCLGCCWALFTVLVVAGMMSLAWMLLLTLVVFAEKVFPHGRRISLAVGAGFIVMGGVLLASGGRFTTLV
jgi:predicted metal-binding membrane protein